MADNKKNVGKADRGRINVNQAYELQYWKEMFGVSGRQLAAAVRKVGPSVKKVAAHLESTKSRSRRARPLAPRR